MNKQKGFGLLPSLLLLAIVGLIGFTGWYVWHSKQTTDKSQSNTVQASAASSTDKLKSLVIEEWGVEADYSGSLTLQYSFRPNNGNFADVSSSELIAADSFCAAYGGHIQRLSPSDIVDPGPDTAEQFYKLNSQNMAHVGNYYFMFFHDQAACSEKQAATDLQAETSNVVKALIPKLELIP